jgi:hypothetical protein
MVDLPFINLNRRIASKRLKFTLNPTHQVGMIFESMTTKDGNGYPLPVCSQVKNLMGTDSGLSFYPWMRI